MMKRDIMPRRFGMALGCAVVAMVSANAFGATNVTVTITNELGAGSFSFTPVWFAFQNGGFDSYDNGAAAVGFPGLEDIAEGGMTGPISAAFGASAAGVAGGVDATLVADGIGAPVFSPGETMSMMIDVGDPMLNRYFSYASMVVPSNDLFFANGDPLAYQIFDAAGNFLGPIEILIFGSDVNDAGTEVNDANGGAAFSALGGVSADEGGLVTTFFAAAGAPGYLTSFVGTDTADGGTISATFGRDDLIARISIVPAPSGAALALCVLAPIRRRRR